MLLTQSVLTAEQYGVLLGVGTLFYASGKLSSGYLSHTFGAKRLAISAMYATAFGAAMFAIPVPFNTAWIFLAWIVSRIVSSTIWTAWAQVSLTCMAELSQQLDGMVLE